MRTSLIFSVDLIICRINHNLFSLSFKHDGTKDLFDQHFLGECSFNCWLSFVYIHDVYCQWILFFYFNCFFMYIISDFTSLFLFVLFCSQNTISLCPYCCVSFANILYQCILYSQIFRR